MELDGSTRLRICLYLSLFECCPSNCLAGIRPGKLGTLKLMRSEHCQEMFREIWQSWKSSTELFQTLQPFTCKLYTASTTTVDINTARHQLFCARRGEFESTQPPPWEDCLFMHTMHANYQAGIWSCSLQQHPQVPSPVKRGWVRNDDG